MVGCESFTRSGFDTYAMKRGEAVDKRGRSVPFVVEAASRSGPERIIEAVNFTPSLHEPFGRWVFWENEKRVSLSDLVKNKGRTVIVHLMCPNITWLNPSKGELDPEPFEMSLSCVRNAVRSPRGPSFTCERIIGLTSEVFIRYPHLQFTARQVFYQLCTTYGSSNSKTAYKTMIKALVEGRYRGILDPERMVDLSRPEYVNNPREVSSLERLRAELDDLVDNFTVNLWERQPVFPEVWIEKEALSRVILPACRSHNVNLIVGRGYSSYTQIYKAIQRFSAQAKEKVIILYLGDHDASGLHIEEKLRSRLEEQTKAQGKKLEIEVRRIALTYDQVQKYGLPPSPLKQAQKSVEYRRKFGDRTWELDALDPSMLQSLVTEEIEGITDMGLLKESKFHVETFRSKLERKAAYLLAGMADG